MANIGRIVHFDIDLSLPLKQVHASPMIEGDRKADVIEITLNNRGEAVDPSGLVAVANAELSGQDGVTVRNPGTVGGGKITIPLQAECYAVPGSIRITVTLAAGSTTRTVLVLTGYVEQKGTGIIIDPSGSIPSYDDLARLVQELETAKQAANTATTAANTAASNAASKASAASTAAQTADTAAANAASKARAADEAAGNATAAADAANAAAAKIDGLTVSATGLAAGAAPTAAVSETGGHKHIAFGIPKGDKGDTGRTPNLTIGTVTTGAPGTQAAAALSGTAENPVLSLTIPRGDMGDIGALTINGKAPDGSGSVTLTPEDVGARPDTWTPTATDVGALPSGGTAADAARLGGKDPAYYGHPYNLLDNSDFRQPINQRGETTYTGNAYTIDRWALWSNDGTASLTVDPDGLTITRGSSTAVTLAQRFEKGHFATRDYTFAYADGAGNVYIKRDPIKTANPNFDYIDIEISTQKKVVWAALYEGTYTAATLPPYRPKGYMAELLACQRYYYPFKPSNTALSFSGWHYSTSAVRVALQLPVAMAISTDRVPTVPINLDNIRILPGVQAPTSMQVIVVSPNMICLSLGVEGTQHDLCAMRVNAPLVIVAPD